ncbi:MAG: maleylacetoacetate isomerase [Pseudomonadota bacterium]
MKLFSYWRSTTSFRVRGALNLKGLQYELRPVDLVAGEQAAPTYKSINPGKGVPTLVLDDGTVLTQSMAILEYLDEAYPTPPLQPEALIMRTLSRATASAVATDIHPVNNLRVVNALKSRFDVGAAQLKDWMCHWMAEGFQTVETLLPGNASFSFGEAPGIADLCIVAQCYNARRWGLDLSPYIRVQAVEAACLKVPEIQAAHPDNQPDRTIDA